MINSSNAMFELFKSMINGIDFFVHLIDNLIL